MRKTRIIALVLCISVMLMGAGYAYWSDTLTINNTVTTGEFKVQFMNDGGYPKIFGATGEQYVTKSLTQVDDHTATVTIGNMYPGRVIRYEMKIKNTGTIPAVFDYAKITYGTENTPGFTEKLLIQPFVKKYHADGTAYQVGEAGYWAGKSLGWKPVADLQVNLNNIMAGCSLEPGEFITFDVPDEYMEQWLADNPDATEEQCIEIRLPETVGSPDNPNEFERATAVFNIAINWRQHNAPATNPIP